MAWEMHERVDLARPQGLHVWPDVLLVPGDCKAHRWCVSVYQAGVPFDLTGWAIRGYITRCRDDVLVPIDGSAEGCEASVVFDAACYAGSGELYGIMQITRGEERISIACGRWRLGRGPGDQVVDPENVIPSLQELLAEISNLRAATEAAEAATGRAQSVVDTYKDTVDVQDAQLIDLRHRADNAEAALGLSAAPGKNLLDPADVVSGQWSTGGTTLNPDAAYISYAHRIPVKGGTTYTISNDGISEAKKVATLTEYAADGSRPGISQYWADTTFTTAATTVELLISLEATWDKPQLEAGSTATAYEPYGDHVTSRMQDEIDALEAGVAGKADRLLYGGKICSYGDSNAANDDGNRSVKAWVDYAAEQLGCARAYNRGVGSTTVTAVTKDGTPRTGYVYVDAEGDAGEVRGMYTTPRTFADYPTAVTPWMCTEQRIATIPEDTDAVVIIAGTNDVGTTTIEGFSEAYGQMLDLMAALRPAMRIYTCTLPFQQTYDMGSAAERNVYNSYRLAIKRVSAQHGIPCIDLKKMMGVNADNCADYMNDATHYNTEAGRKLIASCVCNALMTISGYAGEAGLAFYAREAEHAVDADTVRGVDVVAQIAKNAEDTAAVSERVSKLSEENTKVAASVESIIRADYELVSGKTYVPVGEMVTGKRFAFPSTGTVGQLIYINDYARKNLITAAVKAGEAYRIKASSGNDDRYNSAYAIADADGICLAFHREEGGGYHVYENIVMPSGAATLYAQAADNQDAPSIEKIVADPENSEYISKTRKDIEAKLAKEHKARFDDSFLYISYSSVNGAGASINTAEMYEYCAKNGFNALKGDVRPTSDGGVIMCHDVGFTLDDNGDIIKFNSDNCTLISTLTEAQCIALKHAGTGNYVCNLETFLRICKKYGKIAYITIRDEQIAEVVVPVMYALLDKYNMRTRCIINSFTVASLEAVRAVDNDIMLSRVSVSSEGANGISKAFVDSAIALGNCRVAIFSFSSSSTDVTILDNSAEAIAYAIENDVRVDCGQVGAGISIDDVLARGVVGAQMVVVPDLN